jgi:catechol 2,3-dioxygenase-like lactoylglutathione lyase family enzyme
MERDVNEASSPGRLGVDAIDAQRVDFIAVPTQDRERAERFYANTLGLRKNPNSTENWIEFETGNVTLALVTPTEIGLPFEPLPFASVVLRVPDVAEARSRLEAAGVEFPGETFDSGVCSGAAFRDPDGNGLMIHHRYAAYPDGTQP